MENTELKAAEALLGKGVSIDISAPFLVRCFGKKKVKLNVKPLRSGVLYRISYLYLKSGINIEELEEMDLNKSMKFYRKHAHEISLISATAMLGYFSGRFFSKWLAGLLFRNSKPSELCMLFYSIIMFSGMEDFLNTIRLISTMKMTEPRNLSPENQGS